MLVPSDPSTPQTPSPSPRYSLNLDDIKSTLITGLIVAASVFLVTFLNYVTVHIVELKLTPEAQAITLTFIALAMKLAQKYLSGWLPPSSPS